MFARIRTSLSVLALAAIAGACGSDSSTGPSSNQSTTLDQALTELTNPALSAANSAFFNVDAAAPAPALLASRCPYVAASQSFVCTPFATNGVAINQSFTLLTASNATQAAFDAATTDAVRATTTVAGTVTQSGTSLAIDGQQELTLSGLISGPHTLNGTSTTKIKGTIFDGVQSFPLDATVTNTITNLVLPAKTPGTAQLWPSSGTIVVENTGTVGGFSSGTTRITMTFSGSSTVSVTVLGPGVLQSCKMDFSKSNPVCG